MKMLFEVCTALIACVAVIQCRDIKSMKPIPTISNSLVNLGKMDISFYINSKDSPLKDSFAGPTNSFLFSKSEPVDEPCPCSNLRNLKDPLMSSPSDILNKLLMSNDLFSNKEPFTSTLCCDSHEHDEFVTVELGPKHSSTNLGQTSLSALPALPALPGLPFIFENLRPKKSLLMPGSRSKAVEIFLFPKNKESLFMPLKKDFLKKDSIQIVGDKDFRNDLKNIKFRSPLPIISSVKKDLTAQEKNETKTSLQKDESVQMSNVPNRNAIV